MGRRNPISTIYLSFLFLILNPQGGDFIGVAGTIWSTGIHNMWLYNPKTGKMEPSKVYVSPESLKKDYEILKENLPIPLGIDHLDLDSNVLKKNKILQKMNLLNVGLLRDVKLEDNKIKITDAEITNPIIKELHQNGELNDFSKVSKMNVKPCPTGMADQVEKYSVINRVDFVGNGACEKCKVDMPLAASSSAYNAKAIIKGDESMAADPNAGNPADPGADPNAQDPKNNEPATLDDVVAAIGTLGTKIDKVQSGITALEGKAGIKEPVDPNADPNAQNPPAAASEGGEGEGEKDPEGGASKPDPEVVKLRKEMDELKGNAAKAEAEGIVSGFLEEGKIKPAETEKHVAMAMKAPEEYQEVMKEAPKIIDMERHSQGGTSAASNSTKLVDEDGEEIDLEKISKEQDKMMGKGGD